ncbi:MAG TPA: type VI secretion system-associated FHA domain protein TagH [Gammaproteobacteria bacterium]|nr:type VI secretion system-associated FHA domain protein TagH [Gammaproteobacteria bacterium]
MALRLTILSAQTKSLGERQVKEFGRNGGTIGRSLRSDWVLPDAQRYLSSRHASIDFRSGCYYVVDTSTNGVFVNGAEQPVGRGKPQRLFDGDRIRIGDYVMAVQMTDSEDDRPWNDEHHVDPVDLALRVEAPAPVTGDLVDAFEVTGVGLEALLTEDEAATLTPPSKLDTFEMEIEIDDRPAPAAKALVEPRAEREPKPQASPARPAVAAQTKAPVAAQVKTPTVDAGARRPTAPPARAVHPLPAANPAHDASAARGGAAAQGASPAHGASIAARNGLTPVPDRKTPNPLAAFFRGAGLAPQQLDAQQTEQVLLQLGQLMREMIVGVSESLHLRAEQKNALHIANTTIQRQDNNPLKFSASVEETLAHLLFRRSQEYLPPVVAVREAYADIRLHQQSLLAALRPALDAFAQRLDPEGLEQKFSRGKGNRLMGAANKMKYWDLYKDLHHLVAGHAPAELPTQFLDDFSQAYEAERARASTQRRNEKKAQAG